MSAPTQSAGEQGVEVVGSSESVSDIGAELPVRAPVQGADVGEAISTAEGQGDNVIDFPSVLALLSVVVPHDQVPVSVDAIFGGRDALDRATRLPRGDLLLFSPRQLG